MEVGGLSLRIIFEISLEMPSLNFLRELFFEISLEELSLIFLRELSWGFSLEVFSLNWSPLA